MSRRVTATERVERILAVLPWLVENQGASVEQIAARFGMDRDDVVADLEFVFHNVGLHPFTPDMLADIFIEDDRVTVHLGDYFHRPLRLTHPEALALLGSARAVLARPRSDPDGTLRRAVAKLEAVLGPGADDAVGVLLGSADPEVLATVESALAERVRLEIEYFSYGRDEVGSREVDPLRLVARDGHWYVLAHCHSAEGERLFRVDRIRAARATGDPVRVSGTGSEVGPGPGDGVRTVEIVGGPSTAWVSATYPCDEVGETAEGRLRTVTPVTTTTWLERVGLRLEPDAGIRDTATGEDLRPTVTAAARRVLARYRASDGTVTADG